MGGFIAGGSRDEVELRQLHVTCNDHSLCSITIMIIGGMLKSYEARLSQIMLQEVPTSQEADEA